MGGVTRRRAEVNGEVGQCRGKLRLVAAGRELHQVTADLDCLLAMSQASAGRPSSERDVPRLVREVARSGRYRSRLISASWR